MKDAPGFKVYHTLLITLLLACTVFLTGCFGDSSNNSSPASSTSGTQASAITPIGVPATCLTVNSPSLVKLAEGSYQLVDVIDNCSGHDAGPLQITAQINVGTSTQSTYLIGPATISANGKAIYNTSKAQTSGTNKAIHFLLAPPSSYANITVLATIKGAQQGEWDGQVAIPGS